VHLASVRIHAPCVKLGFSWVRANHLPILVSQGVSYLFLHPPKCGGSSVVDTFSANGYDVELQIRGKPPQECLTVSPQHQTCSVLKSLLRLENISDVFIVTRNPYQRVLSEYNWMFRDVPPQDRIDYSDWVVQELAKATSSESYADNHFRQIIDFIDLSTPTRVFRLEDSLDAIIEFYLQPLGALKNISVYHKKKTSSFKYHSLNCKLNSQALCAINDFYKHDFAAFGYTLVSDPVGISCQQSRSITSTNLAISTKIEEVRRWRAETLRVLNKKLQTQIDFLYNYISSADQVSLASCSSEMSSETTRIAIYKRLYDNLAFRLECLDQQLDGLRLQIANVYHSIPIEQMVSLVKACRSRIDEMSISAPSLK
jgi:hypothetical protein